jgi:hypothetical protein
MNNVERNYNTTQHEAGESTPNALKIVITYNLYAINFLNNVWTSHFELFWLVLSIFD